MTGPQGEGKEIAQKNSLFFFVERVSHFRDRALFDLADSSGADAQDLPGDDLGHSLGVVVDHIQYASVDHRLEGAPVAVGGREPEVVLTPDPRAGPGPVDAVGAGLGGAGVPRHLASRRCRRSTA